MTEQHQLLNEDIEEKPIDWIKIITEYIVYWPFILCFFIITLACTFVYLRFQEPVFQISSSVLIKQSDHSKSNIPGLDAVQNLGTVSMVSNFDNEIIILQSQRLIKHVVADMGLYINYKEDHLFSYSQDLYKCSPVNVWMSAQDAEKLPSAITLKINCQRHGRISIHAELMNSVHQLIELNQDFEKLPATLSTPVGDIILSLPSDSALWVNDKEREINVSILRPSAVANAFKGRLSGDAAGKTTSIINLTYKDVNPQRGTDFLRHLVNTYNSDTNEDKNTVATKTAKFIDERILIINEELDTTENKLARYKQKVGLNNLDVDALFLQQSNFQFEKKLIDNANQIKLIEFLKDYINNPANQYEVIPVNVGLQSSELTNIISQYNELLMEKKTLSKSSNETNPTNQKLNIAIEMARKGVFTTVNSVEKGLHLTQKNYDDIVQKYAEKIQDTPQREKELISIKRQQEIKSNLYLMLLQKREENAITLATTANNGKIVEDPQANGPISPKKSMIMLAAIIAGIALPIGLVFLRNLLKLKIEYRSDVEQITKSPIIGDIPHIKKKETGIVIKENNNELEEEVFRFIRTNIKSTLRENEKVALFTSSIPHEGKSFTASNLAASIAYMGKKTLIVDLDIRKPGLHRIFSISHKADGITQYLSHPNEYDLLSLCQRSKLSNNLYILPAGAIPLNPTELVSDENLDKAFEILRNEFDFILVDSAPAGIVTDTQIISRIADLTIYICRAGYTPKNSFSNINRMIEEKKLPRVFTIINGINMNKRRNGYYYGYGKYGHYGKYGYGYGYGYGLGYRYGYNDIKTSK